MDGSQPSARQHGDGQLGNHRQVEGDAVAGLHACEGPEQHRELVHPPMELLIRDGLRTCRFRLGHPDERGFIAARCQVPVDAVEAGIQTAADEPLPERRIARVERGMPVGVPREQVSILLKALREALFAKPLANGRVGRIRLRDEGNRGVVVLLLAPMNRDLRFRNLARRFYRRRGGRSLSRCSHRSSSYGRPPLEIPGSPLHASPPRTGRPEGPGQRGGRVRACRRVRGHGLLRRTSRANHGTAMPFDPSVRAPARSLGRGGTLEIICLLGSGHRLRARLGQGRSPTRGACEQPGGDTQRQRARKSRRMVGASAVRARSTTGYRRRGRADQEQTATDARTEIGTGALP
jgi:hypothetical protein